MRNFRRLLSSSSSTTTETPVIKKLSLGKHAVPQAPLPKPVPPFKYTPLFREHSKENKSDDHEEKWDKLQDASKLVSLEKNGRLQVDPKALILLCERAMKDVAHLLRPGHLAQLRVILDDPEASDNDKFVALQLLKNAVVAAGFVLPSCQGKMV